MVVICRLAVLHWRRLGGVGCSHEVPPLHSSSLGSRQGVWDQPYSQNKKQTPSPTVIQLVRSTGPQLDLTLPVVISISFFLPDNQWSERNVICIIRYWMEYHNHYYYIIITNLSFIFYNKNIFKCFSTIKLIRPFEKFKGNSCSGLLLGWRLMAVIMIVGLRQEAIQCQYAHDLDRYNHGGWGGAQSAQSYPDSRQQIDS